MNPQAIDMYQDRIDTKNYPIIFFVDTDDGMRYDWLHYLRMLPKIGAAMDFPRFEGSVLHSVRIKEYQIYFDHDDNSLVIWAHVDPLDEETLFDQYWQFLDEN